MSRPLTKTLRQSESVRFSWTAPDQQGFEELIKKVTCEPVLMYDFATHLKVQTDASAAGIAGALLQSYSNKDWYPVAYLSRTGPILNTAICVVETLQLLL